MKKTEMYRVVDKNGNRIKSFSISESYTNKEKAERDVFMWNCQPYNKIKAFVVTI